MRCMFSAALQSLSSHLPGCCAGLALAALPWALPVPLAGRSKRGSPCPAGGFQPAHMVGCSWFSSPSHDCLPFTAELTRVVRCSSTSTTLPRSLFEPLGLHSTLQQARSTASAPQPPLVPMPAVPKNTTSCLARPWRSMDSSATSSSTCGHAHKAHTWWLTWWHQNCSSARSWAPHSLSQRIAHLGSRYTSHTMSQVARVTVMCFRLATRDVPAELAAARCWRCQWR
ncbi:hypothetical protein V8C86DRAFT_2743931, partial [Haematococcus lacustris]